MIWLPFGMLEQARMASACEKMLKNVEKNIWQKMKIQAKVTKR
jgi:hypothetical protein